MSESVQRLRANRPLEGRACGWCGRPLAFGEPAAVCRSCGAAAHAGCWDREGGCATGGCVNRPLQRLDEPAAGAPLPVPLGATAPPGAPALPAVEMPEQLKQCPHCGFRIAADSTLCSYCNLVPTADGIYRGPKTNAPGAVASLVFGILAFFVCGIIFGLIAIGKANDAKKAIASDPRLGGEGLATTGRILGILALVFWGLWMVLAFAGMMAR